MPRIRLDGLEKKQVPAPLPSVVEASLHEGHNHNPETAKELYRQSGGKLSAFCAFPQGVSFEDRHNDEEIILLVRRHWVTNAHWVLITVALIALPTFFAPAVFFSSFFSSFPLGFRFVLMVFWYLGTITYAFLNFLYWYFNVGIVTDERIMDVDWHSLTDRETTTTLIEKVQDVSPRQVGVMPGIFDFGDVNVQTAGSLQNIEFTAVPHPNLVAKTINELMQPEGGNSGG